MSPSIFRRPLAGASIAAVGAVSVLGLPATAQASHPGTNGQLTASNRQSHISEYGGAQLVTPETIIDAAWSPESSRAVFVNEQGLVGTVRHDDGYSVYSIAPPIPGVERADPRWIGDGSRVVWAAKPAGQTWRLETQPSGPGFEITRLSPDDGNHYLNPDTGTGQRIVYEKQGAGAGSTPEVGLYDPAGGFTTITTNASNPAISPDGKRVAFVRDGQIWTSNLSGGDLVQVTSNAATHDDPTWSPDGTTIAFSQGSLNQVATASAGGQDAANPFDRGIRGVPAYKPLNRDRVVRLAGQDRHSTAVAVSRSYWATTTDPNDRRQRAQAVVLSRSDNFADALGGSALAAAKRGPLLMTAPSGLNPTTSAELQRILPTGRTVYLLGGEGALSKAVADQISALGYTVVRLAGSDRAATSLVIANAVDPTPDLVLTATGLNFPDALAAGAAAGARNIPGSGTSAVVVLTNDANLPAGTRSYLDRLPASTGLVAIGGQAVTATNSYTNMIPVSGSNRYETALFTAWSFFGGQTHVGLATGTNWPDALAGGALMASLNGPLMLTPGNSNDVGYEAYELLSEFSGSVHSGLIFGGRGAVAQGQEAGIGYWIGGGLGHTYAENPTNVGVSSTSRVGAKPAGAGATGAQRSLAEIKAAAKTITERSAR